MSHLNGREETPKVEQDGTVTTEAEDHISKADSNDEKPVDISEKAGEPEAIGKINGEVKDEVISTSAVTKGQIYVGGEDSTTDRKMGGEESPPNEESRARDIEKEASEHLARRAAEMELISEDANSNGAAETRSGADKEELPASPPPPGPPRKDGEKSPVQDESEYDEKHPPLEDPQPELPGAPGDTTESTGQEIQHIMDQFADGMGGLGEQEIMSPRLERQQPAFVLPPRTSSLEHRDTPILTPQTTGQSMSSQRSRTSLPGVNLQHVKSDDSESIVSGKAGSIFQPPPASPEPELSLPFDFHRFLEQLRHRTADPVARFLRSFLNEFDKKQWMVHEQVKIISDFLEFISKKMAQCEVWRTVSDAEFDNAREGMEKLVMNRLYSQTFSPAIPPAAGSPRKGRRGERSQADVASPFGQGRRGQHQEDVERDEVIAQKIRIYGWISEEHLDINPIGDKGKKFLSLAQQELLKINTYRAPRDKVICVLNCCKVIFGFLKNAKSDTSADAFVPLLIYTVLRARPEHLVSNVQYIWRFRNQDKLGGEAGYYMSSLMGVVSFIENLDRTNLTISDEEFEHNVEQAVSAIAEKNKEQEYEEKAHAATQAATSVGPMQHLSEKSALSRAEVIPRNSMEAERSSPRRNVSQRLVEKNQQAQQGPASDDDDTDAVTGVLRSIQKPLSSIGRIFSDDGGSSQQQQSGLRPASTPLPGSTPRGLSPAARPKRRPSAEGRPQRPSNERQRSGQRNAEDAAARQANAEAAQAQRLRAREHKVVIETLQSMFPNLDQEVIEDVTRAQEGNVGRAVDACLALSGGG